ncbi:phage terminase small subunit [Rhodospira trueperi]|uniref:Phage small terminase subunit n=1 Tax=Rhodospira trueperi TaxID=69960 RepID=A0A1G7HX11_9PROT|nr:phage terminase small subunit [Rhodospira trueperi]SDF04629.1 Phage small terminase subunit [Rhodospira trueperi]
MATPAQIARARSLALADAARAHAAGSPAGPAPAGPAPAAGSGLDRMLAQLKRDRDQLRGIQSMVARAEAKRELMPDYMPYVDGVLEADTGRQDPVVVHMMIWALDVGDHATMLRLAGYVIRHGLAMPEGFERPPAAWLVEELARVAMDDPAALPHLDDALRLTSDMDMHDPIRAKALRVLGEAVLGTDPALAVERLERALAYDPKVGARKALDAARKAAAQAAESDPEDAETP